MCGRDMDTFIEVNLLNYVIKELLYKHNCEHARLLVGRTDVYVSSVGGCEWRPLPPLSPWCPLVLLLTHPASSGRSPCGCSTDRRSAVWGRRWRREGVNLNKPLQFVSDVSEWMKWSLERKPRVWFQQFRSIDKLRRSLAVSNWTPLTNVEH